MQFDFRPISHMDNLNISIGERDLKSADFDGLLQRLHPDRNSAAERYEDLRRKLMRFFRWNDCFPGEELADQAFDRVARKLGSEQIHDVPAFLWGVARNIVREFRKRPPTVNFEELPPLRQPHTSHAELSLIEQKVRERRLQCLRKCLEQLTASDRELFLAYEYFAGKARSTRQLAERFGISVGALQTRAHRVKHRVEKCALKRFLSAGKSFEEDKES